MDAYKDFNAAMTYLKKAGLITTQKELALILGFTPGAISSMRRTGRFPLSWLETIAEWLTSQTNDDAEVVLEEMKEAIPDYDEDKAPGEPKETLISGRDFFMPSRAAFDAIFDLPDTAADYLSQDIAIRKRSLPGSGSYQEVTAITYQKDNMEPSILPGDILIIRKCQGYQGEGLYVFQDYATLSVRSVRKNAKNELEVKPTLNSPAEIIGDFTADFPPRAKVLGIYRCLT